MYGDIGESAFNSPYCWVWCADEKMRTGIRFVCASEPEPGYTTQSNASAGASRICGSQGYDSTWKPGLPERTENSS